jgi:hypothetical protein
VLKRYAIMQNCNIVYRYHAVALNLNLQPFLHIQVHVIQFSVTPVPLLQNPELASVCGQSAPSQRVEIWA